jgi:hypothetical protein
MATPTLPMTLQDLRARVAARPYNPAEARRFALEWNASQPEPSPVCPRCEYFFEADQHGDLFPRWCCNCEADLLYRCLRRLVRRFGRKGARIKLAALVRTSVRTSK